jgi:signal transduction histidine kinase
MVQSSLENLQADESQEQRTRYTERALEGIRRLNLILHRLREATRLEHAFQSAELSRIDITELCRSLCEGYRISHPEITFEWEQSTAVEVLVAPELISQALDKLVDNAIDFHHAATPIHIALALADERHVQIRVENQGPALPPGMESALFESMVSVRNHGSVQPHLGLGLYLVKLIMEFHNGRACAENLRQGVRFSLILPLS